MSTYVPFIDITGAYAAKAPLVKGSVRAYYATGSQGIEETAAQIAAAKAAGMGIALIDQMPGLPLFRAGLADIGDIEYLAGTDWDADTAVAQRQTHTWQSTLYVSYSAWPALKGSIRNPAGVIYGVADYSWSQAEAETLLDGNADLVYAQYGDPGSNPSTLVPGTSVTLRECNADIDIAKASWADEFLPKPAPPPAGPYWQTATGRQSLAAVMAARGGKVSTVVTLTETHGSPAEVAAFEAYLAGFNDVMPAGLRFATVNP